MLLENSKLGYPADALSHSPQTENFCKQTRPLSVPGAFMWRTRLARTWDWIRSRRLVGEDEHHLYYSEFIARDKPERRYVEYKDRDITHASDRMPIEWWSWLHNRRNAVPTTEELALSEHRMQTLAERVAILEAEDEKQRLRQYSRSTQDPVRAERKAAKRRNVFMNIANQAPATQNTGDLSLIPTNQAEIGHDDAVKRNVKEDPQGTGQTFQPGSWNPSPSRRRGRQT